MRCVSRGPDVLAMHWVAKYGEVLGVACGRSRNTYAGESPRIFRSEYTQVVHSGTRGGFRACAGRPMYDIRGATELKY